MGTLNVLMACRYLGVKRLVHTSSSEVYGTARQVPIDEGHPLQGQSPYSASKIGADKLAESFFCAYDLPVVTVRPFNTFGPRQTARAVIPAIISQALAKSTVRLGNLTTKRDFTYVSDTVRGFLLAAEAAGVEGQVFNLGAGQEIARADIAVHEAQVLSVRAANHVEVVEGVGRTGQRVRDRPHGHELLLLRVKGDDFSQREAAHVLHHQVEQSALLTEIEDADDVRVAEEHPEPSLVGEHRAELLVTGELGKDAPHVTRPRAVRLLAQARNAASTSPGRSSRGWPGPATPTGSARSSVGSATTSPGGAPGTRATTGLASRRGRTRFVGRSPSSGPRS